MDIRERLSNGLYYYLWAVAREVEESWGGWGAIVGISVDDLQHVMVQAVLEREREEPGYWADKGDPFVGRFGKWQAGNFLRYWLGMKRSRTAPGGWRDYGRPISMTQMEEVGRHPEQNPWPPVELRLVIEQVLDDLGDSAYRTIAVRLVEGQSYQAIGQEIGASHTWAWRRKNQLKEALQEALA